MNKFVSVECADSRVGEAVISSLIAELSSYIQKTELFSSKNKLSGIRVLINANHSSFSEVSKIGPQLFWTVGEGDVSISADAWSKFQLYCIGLPKSIMRNVESILLVLTSKIESSSTTSSSATDDSSSEEPAQSFEAVTPKYTLDKVIMPEDDRNQIERAISLVRAQKQIFEEWGFSEVDPHTKTILCFFGAPGTGKTMCAHAIASALGKKIVIASYASIESKWVGEGPKNMRRIFKDAEEQDAVLFFDEADSFLSKRVANAETGSDKHYNRMSNEMFQLLEEYGGVVIFATNMVADFDKAFKSRILSFVEFKLPDLPTRKRLIEVMTPSKLPMQRPLNDAELESLANIGEGFSGREIRKAMLTTLADAATRGVETFTFEEFKSGFVSVKEECESVEASAKGEVNSSLLMDFMSECEVNAAIKDICAKTICQGGQLSSEVKVELFRICKVLGVEQPDLSIDYKNKDIEEAAKKIIDNDRSEETMKYCCNLLALLQMDNNDKKQYVCELAEQLGITNSAPWLSLVESLQLVVGYDRIVH